MLLTLREYNFYYFLFWACVFWIGMTIFGVPYVAMGYEMSTDFHERTRIMAVAQWIGQWAWVIAPWFWIICMIPIGTNQPLRAPEHYHFGSVVAV